MMGTGHTRARAIVVGGGVSGCACAATLALAGVRVTVVSSALDTVGLPAYGPDVVAEPGGRHDIRSTLSLLPRPLRDAWLDAGMVAGPAGAGTGPADITAAIGGSASSPRAMPAWFNVDRRMLSVETKRALEKIPGLEFRQGLVRDIRLQAAVSGVSAAEGGDPRTGPGCGAPPAAAATSRADAGAVPSDHLGGGRHTSGTVVVETVFGEVFEAEVAIICVGLSMGGRVTVGDDLLPGGRYGEMASDGMREALERLGVGFEEVNLEIGARFSRDDEWMKGVLDADHSLHARGLGRESQDRWGEAGGAMPEVPVGDVRMVRLVPARAAFCGPLPEEEGGPEAGARRFHEPGEAAAGAGRCGGGNETGGVNGVADGHETPADAAGPAARPDPGGPPAWPDTGGPAVWPDDFPPAPHWEPDRRLNAGVAVTAGDGGWERCVSPDGISTREVYIGCSLERAESLFGWRPGDPPGSRPRPLATRLSHTVRGLAVRSVEADGRLLADGRIVGPIWVAGRAGGAAGYLESLASGVCAARSVIEYLGGEGASEGGGAAAGSDPAACGGPNAGGAPPAGGESSAAGTPAAAGAPAVGAEPAAGGGPAGCEGAHPDGSSGVDAEGQS